MGIILAFLSVVLIWGSTWYAIELQLGVVAKEWSVAYRFLLASAILFVWCLATRRKLRFNGRDHLWAAATGLFLFSGNYFFIYWGTEYLTSGLVAVAFSMLSFCNIINARVFLKTPIQPAVLLAAIVGIIGLAFIFEPEIERLSFTDTTTLGFVLCVASTLMASWGNTLAATESVRRLPLLPFNAWGMLYGGLFNVIAALVQNKPLAFDPRPEYWMSLVYLSIVGTVVAFTAYLWLIGKIGVARAAYAVVLTPLVALVISTFLEGYVWTPIAAAGLAMVVAGNVLMVNSRTKKARQP